MINNSGTQELENAERSISDRTDCLSPIIFGFSIIWVLGITIVPLLIEFTLSSYPPALNSLYPFGRLIAQIVLLSPLILLWIFWKNPIYKAVFKVWSLSIIFLVLTIPAHLVSPSAAQLKALIFIFANIIFATGIYLISRQTKQREMKIYGISPALSDRRLPVALIILALYALPWVTWGALGSLLDSIIGFTAGLSFGIAATLLWEFHLFIPNETRMKTKIWFYILNGIGAAVSTAIFITGSGFPFGTMQLALFLSMPLMIFSWAGLRSLSTTFDEHKILPANTMISLIWVSIIFCVPTMFIDADELGFIIGFGKREIIQWTFSAAGLNFLLGLILTIVLFIFLAAYRTQRDDREANARNTTLLMIFFGFSWLAVLLAYLVLGQPGFYGDRVFVYLKEKIDIQEANKISDLKERRRWIYTTLVNGANESQKPLREALARWGFSYSPYYLENGIEINSDPWLSPFLHTFPQVDHVVESPHLRPLPKMPGLLPTVAFGSPGKSLDNLAQIGADKVWTDLGITGKGVVIGQADSGTQWDHPDLLRAYRGKDGNHNFNWYDPWNHTIQPNDANGHGTHTLGTIVGKNTGIAPGAVWIACENLYRNLGNIPFYLDCWQFLFAPFPLDGNPFKDGVPDLGADVINNSWGCPEIEGCDALAFNEAVKALTTSGVFIAAGAGNDGPFCDTLNTPPPIYEDSFAVGAIDSAGNLAIFSSIGPVTADGSGRIKPDIIAPGVDITSTFPDDSYTKMSGTSMATPHVSGVVALMWSANPELKGNIEATRKILTATAKPFQGSLPNCQGADGYPSTAVGYGILNAYDAVVGAINYSK